MIDERLIICAVIAAGVHVGGAAALDQLPAREPPPVRTRVQVRVVEAPPPPPPEPEPPKPPEPPPPVEVAKPITKPIEARRPTPKPAVATAPEPVETPPQTATVTGDTTPTPVFGVPMESTSQAPSATSVPVGNTTQPAPAGPAKATPALAAPAAAHEVTKMPLPQGRCAGQYTDAARAAGIEGVVVLDLVVDAEGRAREVKVIEGLAHGLSEAAVAALTACRFTPGERSGQPVSVRIRGFKIRFVLDAGD